MIIPSALDQYLQQRWQESYSDFAAVLHQPAPISLRLHPHKLAEQNDGLERVPWARKGRYLPERPSFTLDPWLHAGAYYVQEASSMFLEQAVRATVDLDEPLQVLDLCAAPGGKSTHLLSLLNEDSFLVANEVIRARANILGENLSKWGADNVMLTQLDPADFQQLPAAFDLIVVDAPCSGEGLIRRDPAAMAEWSEANVQLCSERQRRILMDVWPALRPGGVLIYSTCTYNAKENEANLAWLQEQVAGESLRIPLEPSWGVTEIQHQGLFGYGLYPQQLAGEGFFLTAVRKGGVAFPKEANVRRKVRKAAFQSVGKSLRQELLPWMKQSDGKFLFQHQDTLRMLPELAVPLLEKMSAASLQMMSAGLPLATIKGKDLRPEQALATWAGLNQAAFSYADVDRSTALGYLRKEPIALPAAKGWTLVGYEGLPLGWAKALPRRVNNYYPMHWRIRMSGESQWSLSEGRGFSEGR